MNANNNKKDEAYRKSDISWLLSCLTHKSLNQWIYLVKVNLRLFFINSKFTTKFREKYVENSKAVINLNDYKCKLWVPKWHAKCVKMLNKKVVGLLKQLLTSIRTQLNVEKKHLIKFLLFTLKYGGSIAMHTHKHAHTLTLYRDEFLSSAARMIHLTRRHCVFLRNIAMKTRTHTSQTIN